MITKAEFAQTLRGQDWTACMSENFGALLRHEVSLRNLAEIADGRGWRDLFEAGVQWESQITWATWDEPTRSDEEIKAMALFSRSERWESGWRWAQKWAEAHGLLLSDGEAQALVGAIGSRGPHFSTCGQPDWEALQALIRKAA